MAVLRSLAAGTRVVRTVRFDVAGSETGPNEYEPRSSLQLTVSDATCRCWAVSQPAWLLSRPSTGRPVLPGPAGTDTGKAADAAGDAARCRPISAIVGFADFASSQTNAAISQPNRVRVVKRRSSVRQRMARLPPAQRPRLGAFGNGETRETRPAARCQPTPMKGGRRLVRDEICRDRSGAAMSRAGTRPRPFNTTRCHPRRPGRRSGSPTFRRNIDFRGKRGCDRIPRSVRSTVDNRRILADRPSMIYDGCLEILFPCPRWKSPRCLALLLFRRLVCRCCRLLRFFVWSCC